MKFNFEQKKSLDDELGALWDLQRKYHQKVSTYFTEYFKNYNWESRKAVLESKYDSDALFLLIASNAETNEQVGYIIAALHQNNNGEIESIYLKDEYRKCGLGKTLMDKALSWLAANGVNDEMLVVAAGNEDVFKFYEKFGFYPKYTTLFRKK